MKLKINEDGRIKQQIKALMKMSLIIKQLKEYRIPFKITGCYVYT